MRELVQLKRTLFGLHPAKVSFHFRQMKKLQAQQVEELEAQIKELRAEQEALRAERDAWEVRLHAKTQELQYQDLILQRAQKAVEVLRAHGQQELAEMQSAIDRKQAEHRQKMQAIEQQIESDHQIMQSLLSELGETVLQFNLTSLQQIVAPNTLAEVVATAAHDVDRQPDTLAVKEEAEPLPQQHQPPLVEQRPIDATVPLGRTAPSSGAVKASSAFWGPIDSFLPAEATFADTEWFPFDEREIVRSEEDKATPETAAPFDSPDAPHGTQAKETPAEESKQSEAVSTEIHSVRNRYIVGKIAGADLIDSRGQLLLGKGTVITAELVDLAEREGVLPELIVNMKIAGMSEQP